MICDVFLFLGLYVIPWSVCDPRSHQMSLGSFWPCISAPQFLKFSTEIPNNCQPSMRKELCTARTEYRPTSNLLNRCSRQASNTCLPAFCKCRMLHIYRGQYTTYCLKFSTCLEADPRFSLSHEMIRDISRCTCTLQLHKLE